MSKRDYYEILGVDRDADESAIKKAYRKLAVQYHPDKNPGDQTAEERFREATEAYEVLRDPEKRQRYDQFGHAGVGAGADQGFGGAGGFGGAAGYDFDLSDALRAFMRDFGGGAFGDIFGEAAAGGGRRRAGRGRDLQIKVKLTLEDVANGAEKTIKLRKEVACSTCDGTGSRAGAEPQACPQCQGQGQVRRVQRTLLGQFMNVVVCPQCHGEGTVVTDPCADCNGTGHVRGESTVTVKIPAGVSTGNYLTLKGEGDIGDRGAPPGDVLVVIEEVEHDRFERHGDDVLINVPVSTVDLTLGTKVQVPTVDGRVALKIPSGTQSHKVFRMRSKGIPHLHGSGRGDQLVRIIGWTPQSLGRSEKKALEEMRDALTKGVPEPGRRVYD